MERRNPRELLDFSGRTVLVTGGGTGIGAATVRRFAEAGAAVAVHYNRSREAAEALAAYARSRGVEARALQADLTVEAEVGRLFREVEGTLAAPDILINNAGIYPLERLSEMRLDSWEAMMAANLRSVFLCTREAARSMAGDGERDRSIINIASIEGIQPAPMHSHYNASKGGVITYTKASALELAPIRVNAISPGLIRREGIEEGWPDGVKRWREACLLGELGAPEDVADAALFLSSPGAAWITGQNLCVDGGITARPLF